MTEQRTPEEIAAYQRIAQELVADWYGDPDPEMFPTLPAYARTNLTKRIAHTLGSVANAAIQAERAGRQAAEQWIRASERLPDHGGDVLITSEFGERGIGHATYDKLVCVTTIGKPEWWQELPSPPE